MEKQNSNPTIHTVEARRRRNVVKLGHTVEDQCLERCLRDLGNDCTLLANCFEFSSSEHNSHVRIPDKVKLFELDGDLSESHDDVMMTDGGDPEGVDQDEVFDLIRDIDDPEHPQVSLEQLHVVQKDLIDIKENGLIDVKFTPTIPHCSMATLIGLCLRVKLMRSLPSNSRVRVRITPGTHASEMAINKQLADKERVAAALENDHLLGVVNKCIGAQYNA